MPSPSCDACKDTCSDGAKCGDACTCGDQCKCGENSAGRCSGCPKKKATQSTGN